VNFIATLWGGLVGVGMHLGLSKRSSKNIDKRA